MKHKKPQQTINNLETEHFSLNIDNNLLKFV